MQRATPIGRAGGGDDGWREYRGRSAALGHTINYVNSLSEVKPTKAEPKLKVGDRVKSTSGLYAGEKGIITFLNKNYPIFCRVQYDGYKGETGEFTDRLELIDPAPSAKDIKVTFKLTGAEAFIESAKQLIEALEALEVEIDDERNSTDTN